MIVRTEPKFVTRVGDAAAVAARQVTVGKCTLRSVFIRNLSAGDIHIQFHDAASAPDEAAVPALPDITLAAGSYYESDTPRSFTAGCYVCASSTVGAKTLALANVASIAAEVV